MWILGLVVIFVIIWAVLKAQENHKNKVDAQLLSNLMSSRSPTQKRSSGYNFDIVGEQAYQRNLKKIAGSKQEESKFHECTAQVSSEPSNPYDKNAIKVEINGLLVGYLSRGNASQLAGKRIKKSVPAVINGGWKDDDTEGNYGVKLAINNPSDLV